MLVLGGVKLFVLLAKVFVFIFFIMLIRWTLPRFRFDQLMGLTWKVLIPLALLNLVAAMVVKQFDLNPWWLLPVSILLFVGAGWIAVIMPPPPPQQAFTFFILACVLDESIAIYGLVLAFLGALAETWASFSAAAFALHPGYVATDMTRRQGPVAPADAARGLITLMDTLPDASSGTFWHARGHPLPW